MAADIRNFEGGLLKNFNKNGFTNQTFTLVHLYELSKSRAIEDPDAPNFENGYLPKLQYDTKKSKDIFMQTVEKTFDISGANCVRYLLINRKGDIYDELDQWTQVLPKSFLARVSCSYRNFDPNSLMLDYFIDLMDIQLNNESEYGSNIITVIDKEIRGGYVNRNEEKIKIDDRISEFDSHRKELFVEFFKYNFGNAIKGIAKNI